jgi:phosphatidate cytidylyltransferase
MLGTRILTAAILVPLVLAALFLLAPVGWGTVSLLVMGVAAIEWANWPGMEKGRGHCSSPRRS